MNTGMDLRLARTAARLTINQVAARMGVNRRTVRRWEYLTTISPELAARYRLALVELTDGVAA